VEGAEQVGDYRWWGWSSFFCLPFDILFSFSIQIKFDFKISNFLLVLSFIFLGEAEEEKNP